MGCPLRDIGEDWGNQFYAQRQILAKILWKFPTFFPEGWDTYSTPQSACTWEGLLSFPLPCNRTVLFHCVGKERAQKTWHKSTLSTEHRLKAQESSFLSDPQNTWLGVSAPVCWYRKFTVVVPKVLSVAMEIAKKNHPYPISISGKNPTHYTEIAV